MEKSAGNSFEYGIIFLTHASKAPHIRSYSNKSQRDEDFEEVLLTSNIEHGGRVFDVITAQKCQTDGDLFCNYDLMGKQWRKEKE